MKSFITFVSSAVEGSMLFFSRTGRVRSHNLASEHLVLAKALKDLCLVMVNRGGLERPTRC